MLAGRTNPWLFGASFSGGMALVDGLDGYLAASTLNLAASGESNARAASRFLGMVVVLFAFGLGGAELTGYEIDQIAFPLGLALFAIVIAIRVWARTSLGDDEPPKLQRGRNVRASVPGPAEAGHYVQTLTRSAIRIGRF